MSVNKVFLISHKTTQTTTESTNIVYPEQTVQGSEWMRLAVVGKKHSKSCDFDALMYAMYAYCFLQRCSPYSENISY